jgi:GNAT-family acetyltransferase (TIGR03103 family)
VSGEETKRVSRRRSGGRARPERAGGDWSESPSISPWRKHPADGAGPDEEVAVDCGWGRVIFAHTFADNERLVEVLREEREERRDIAFYHPDPHVLTAQWPHEFFVDPSHTFRLWLLHYEALDRAPRGFSVRVVASQPECEAVHALFRARKMVPPAAEDVARLSEDPRLCWLVAVSRRSGRVIGTVLGIDHVTAFRDPEGGSSLWSLAVDPQTPYPGVGEALSRALAERFLAKGRRYMDLSVMHDNVEAIALYDKLGFERVPVFAVKRKNPINEPLFTAPAHQQGLNPYARIIADEARLRGISVEVLDADSAYLRLGMGGRFVTCRESLSELTSAVAMSRCDDKRVTHRVLEAAGLRQPEQVESQGRRDDEAFLARHGRIVVKPRRGEQGAGVSVDVRTPGELRRSVRRASAGGFGVLLEEFCQGGDLRIIVIDDEVVAAAIRRPAEVTGTGRHSVRQLLRKQSRRRMAATGGESRIPVDAETRRCVREAGFSLDDVPPEGVTLRVRRTANLHTGGTIHDVTPELSPELVAVAREAARALEIPVVGLDLLVPSVQGGDYVIVEANERPGLANHEPQPTAQRFIDFLFPQSRKAADAR